jgi:hypothetical protein
VRIDDEPDWSFLAALFAAEGRVAFAEKRKAPALDHFLDAVELGTRVGKGGGLSPHHAGMDCIIIGGEGAERCVAGLSAEEAAAAGARLERVIDQLPSYAEAIAQQRRQELEDVRQSLSAPTPELKPGLTREQAFDNADRYLNRVGAMSRQPFWERKPVPVPDTKEVGAYLISYELLGVRWVLTEGRLRLLSVEMALQEYRARKGRYPEGLSDLPAAVARYTTDPCNGKPFVYRLSAERYVLYSIGPDGVDEQGKTVAGDGRGQIPGGDIPAGSLWPAQPQPRRFPVWPVVEPEEFVRGWAPSKTPVLFKKLPPGQ